MIGPEQRGKRCVCVRTRTFMHTCAGTVREAVRNDFGEVDRDWKGQLEFPCCLDSVLKAITFLASE